MRAFYAETEGDLYLLGADTLQVLSPEGEVVRRIPCTEDITPMQLHLLGTNSKYIFNYQADAPIRVINKATGRDLTRFSLCGHVPVGIELTDTQAFIAAGSAVYCFDLETMQEENVIHYGFRIHALAVHRDRLFVPVQQEMHVLSIPELRPVKRFTIEADPLWSLCVGDNRLFIGGDSDITIIDLTTYQPVTKLRGECRCMALAGNTLFAADLTRIRVWDLTNSGLINSLDEPDGIRNIGVWRNQLLSLSKSSKAVVKVWGAK